jgi:hypothetical protein
MILTREIVGLLAARGHARAPHLPFRIVHEIAIGQSLRIATRVRSFVEEQQRPTAVHGLDLCK